MDDVSIENLLKVVDWRLQALGMSDREASLQATGKPDAIREMRRGKYPSDRRLRQIAKALDLELQEVFDGDIDAIRERESIAFHGKLDAAVLKTIPAEVERLPRDVPVFAPIRMDFANGLAAHIYAGGTPVGFATRPPVIAHRRDVFCALMPDTAMSPCFGVGDNLYIDPVRSAVVRDNVFVRMTPLEADTPSSRWRVVVGQVRQLAPDVLTLGHFYNGDVREILLADVQAVMRIMPYQELLSY